MFIKLYALCAALCSSGLIVAASPVVSTTEVTRDFVERIGGPTGPIPGNSDFPAMPKPRQATRNQIIARAKSAPRKRGESALPAVCSTNFDPTATIVAVFENANWSWPEVYEMLNGPYTLETCTARCVDLGTSKCAIAATVEGACYYSPGLTQLYGSSYPASLPGLTCDQARTMYPPNQANNPAGDCSMLYCK